MKIFKFGGSSISNHGNIKKVLSIIKKACLMDPELWVVFSAFGHMTHLLRAMTETAQEGGDRWKMQLDEFRCFHYGIIESFSDDHNSSLLYTYLNKKCAKLEDLMTGISLLKEVTPAVQDSVLSHGELISSYCMNHFFKYEKLPCVHADIRKLIITDRNFGNANVLMEKSTELIKKFNSSNTGLCCTSGFIGSSANGEITTLGRNGSDITAAVLAKALEAEEVQIWTDVSGIMTANPGIVHRAFTIPELSFEEAMEMSHFGAAVVHPKALQPLVNVNIPVRIKNTFNPDEKGSCISLHPAKPVTDVTGISSIEKVCVLTIEGSGLMDNLGIARRIFGCLEAQNISVILITQASSEHSVCFAVPPHLGSLALESLNREFRYDMDRGIINTIHDLYDKSIVAIVGTHMKHKTGISGTLFHALGINNVNVYAIAQGSSELNISVVIDCNDLSKALNCVHDAFFLSDKTTHHVFLAGPGNIGKHVLSLLEKQKQFLTGELHADIEVNGICSSTRHIITDDGITLDLWNTIHDGLAANGSIDSFVEEIEKMNLAHTIFVDCTSSDKVVEQYQRILGNKWALVTPNKKANSSGYDLYKSLHETSRNMKVPFLYETTVCAGLPVVQTIRNLLLSGDKIISIQAVLSGTINYILSRFMDEDISVSTIVRQAYEQGYTEPHPGDDLSGVDVARKLLILIRESGYYMEPDDISVENLVHGNAAEASSVEEFLCRIQQHDGEWDLLKENAQNSNKRLCYMAEFKNNKAHASLCMIDDTHPFSRIRESDNTVSLTTSHYSSRPLIIQGQGAGRSVTAAGVVGDIIRSAQMMI